MSTRQQWNHFGSNGTILEASLLDDNWTNLYKACVKFCLHLGKVFVILGKFIEDLNLSIFFAVLGKFALIQTSLGNFALAQILEGTLIITIEMQTYDTIFLITEVRVIYAYVSDCLQNCQIC